MTTHTISGARDDRGQRLARALLVALALCASAVGAQTTPFTYQGQLTDGGAPANGDYDLQFALFGVDQDGTPIGATQTLPGVAVSNGLFTVELNFGVTAFPGDNRFLEIAVRPAGSGSFTTLTPRQFISSTPYAIRSLNASAADVLSSTCVGCVQDTQIQSVAGSKVSGTISVASVPPGSGNYIQNGTTEQPNANFNISGNGVLDGNLSANAITAAATLSGNVVNSKTQYNIDGDRVLSSAGVQNLFAGVGTGPTNTGRFNTFVGALAGAANTAGTDNSFFGSETGESNTLGAFNSFFGELAGFQNVTGHGNSFFGYQVGSRVVAGSDNTLIGFEANVGGDLTNATAIGARAQADASNALVLGSIKNVNAATADTNVGIGTTSPATRLHVVGNTGVIGNVGIGTTSPVRALQIGADINALFTLEGTSGSPNAAYIRFGDNTGWKLHFGRNREGSGQQLNGSTTGLLMTIQDNGNVGIGTTAPTALLAVNGTTAKPGGGSWGTLSDERLKTIKGRFTPGVDAVMRLQPIRYEYKPDNTLGIRASGEHIGFGAQAVQKVIPEAVTTNDQGYLMVNNDPILWTMLNAIKEQQQQIERLKKEVRQLRAARTDRAASNRRASATAAEAVAD